MRLKVACVIIPVLFVAVACGHGHGHDHGHGHGHEEPPSFKWSQEANEPYQNERDMNENKRESNGHGHHGHGHSHGHGHAHEEPPAHKWSQEANEPYQNERDMSGNQRKATATNSDPKARPSVWVEALAATLAISIAPYIILFFIPVTNRKEHEAYLKILLAFASGGLLGDAFLHLIPHASIAKASIDSHAHSHAHSHSDTGSHTHDMTIGLAVLGGIIAFLVVEKVVRIFKGGHSHAHHAHVEKANGEAKKKADKDGDKKKADKKGGKQGNKKEGQIKVAGYLNLAADFTHNLTDGLAIGASFLAGKSVGTITTLTIFLHEIPHEIGDFAILLQSGCSRRKAMALQLVTALGAFTGTCISLLADGADESAVAWILPFTAGGFIYIATVSVIPELLENTRFWQSVVEVMALLSGVILMMGISYVEEAGHEH